MEQKRVSYNVANTLKEVGYPQDCIEFYYDYNGCLQKRNGCYVNCQCVAPYVMSVWLWLWRKKGIKVSIDIACNTITKVKDDYWLANGNADPEEAIEKAIEYLVDNNLIK